MILTDAADIPRRSKVYALVKFFSENDHAEQFLDGTLFTRRLSYFRRMEEEDGRWDSTEGTWAWLQKKGLQIRMEVPQIGPIHIGEPDLAAPVSMSLAAHDDLHIFCSYAYYVDEARAGDDLRDIYGEDRLAELERALQIDPRCLRFGAHAVVVPWAPFKTRVIQAVRAQSLRLRTGLVRYYDDQIFNGEFRFKDVPFRKQRRFEYQRELRVCIDSRPIYSETRTINIGSLRDIAAYAPAEALLGAFKLSIDREAA